MTLVENNHERWLVAPYGEVSWVINAREISLSRGRSSETVKLVELAPEEVAAIEKQLGIHDLAGFTPK